MTQPSNEKFYQWGYHDPDPKNTKDPILPLTDEQRKIFERVISVNDGFVKIGSELLPSGEGLYDTTRCYNIDLDVDSVHISAPALYPHDPQGVGVRADRGNYYFSSGNYTVWPNPSGEDPDKRYSAYWWDVSGIYFSPNIYGDGYFAYPLLPSGNAAAIVLFDDLDQELYWGRGEVEINSDRKYLLWLDADRNIDQFGIFNYGRREFKTLKFPEFYNRKKKKYIYKDKDIPYFYSHFSNADHNKIDKGFEDFQIFYTYIHYIPELKNEFQRSHEKIVGPNQIPFLSNAKSVYLYSVYGAKKFRDLQAQNWSFVNEWDDIYSPQGIASDFHNILKSPTPPFPPVERDSEESEQQEYNSKEELQKKFNAVSGLLGL
jgi:hypothetical protein